MIAYEPSYVALHHVRDVLIRAYKDDLAHTISYEKTMGEPSKAAPILMNYKAEAIAAFTEAMRSS